MPKLWKATIDEHREEVREAILHAAAQLATKRGLASVRMADVAREAGVGRATLYKYFSDVDAVLVAWHERQVARHMEHLTAIRDGAESARARLEQVLHAYAFIAHEHRGHAGAEALHRRPHVARARRRLRDLIGALVKDCATEGVVRDDVAPVELAAYCLHALGAAADLPSKAAVARLIDVTLAGLRATSRPAPSHAAHHRTRHGGSRHQ